jgi:hypothetical protein
VARYLAEFFEVVGSPEKRGARIMAACRAGGV